MVVIDLQHPVEHAGASYSKLSLRKPNVGDLVAQEPIVGEMSKVVFMLARLANIPVEVVNEIDIEDFQKIAETLSNVVGEPVAAAG